MRNRIPDIYKIEETIIQCAFVREFLCFEGFENVENVSHEDCCPVLVKWKCFNRQGEERKPALILKGLEKVKRKVMTKSVLNRFAEYHGDIADMCRIFYGENRELSKMLGENLKHLEFVRDLATEIYHAKFNREEFLAEIKLSAEASLFKHLKNAQGLPKNSIKRIKKEFRKENQKDIEKNAEYYYPLQQGSSYTTKKEAEDISQMFALCQKHLGQYSISDEMIRKTLARVLHSTRFWKCSDNSCSCYHKLRNRIRSLDSPPQLSM